MKKRTMVACFALLCAFSLLCGCGNKNEKGSDDNAKSESRNYTELTNNTPMDKFIDFEVIAKQAVLKYPTFNDNWKYSLYQDTTGVYDTFVALAQYTGNEPIVNVPSEIEGSPVICLTTAFNRNATAQKVIIPGTVIDIGKEAFKDCTTLTEVALPKSVRKIGDYAFSGCSALVEIIIPDSVTRIGQFTFSGCTSLSKVDLPDSVTEIGIQAFSSCDTLTTIKIPKNVRTLESATFFMCKSLSNVELPANLTSIGNSVFWDCPELKKISIPKSVTKIESDSFDIFGDFGRNSVIYGYPESEAARYCVRYGLSFKVISER